MFLNHAQAQTHAYTSIALFCKRQLTTCVMMYLDVRYVSEGDAGVDKHCSGLNNYVSCALLIRTEDNDTICRFVNCSEKHGFVCKGNVSADIVQLDDHLTKDGTGNNEY